MSETFTIKQDRERYGDLPPIDVMPEEFTVDGADRMLADLLARLLSEEVARDNYFRVLPVAARRRPQNFTTEQFFLGGLHAIDHLIGTARSTNGASVWLELFSVMRANMLIDAEKKGITFK